MTDKLGVTPEEAVGLTCYNVVHGLNDPPLFCPYNELLKDGHEHTIEIHEKNLGGDFIVSVSPLYDTKKKLSGVVHVARDITKRKMVEDEIKKSLDEKKVLLREIHHRVKNNLQIIASLLNLQESTENGEVTDILKESMGRVKTMATIHEKLYESPSLSEINFKEFTEKLVYDILYSYGIQIGTIKTELSIEDIKFNIDTAIPLGLIINELITNSVKYAFPQNGGTITIKLKSLLNKFELIIADNGIGIPKDIDPENTATLGLRLVTTLINQLEGKLKVDMDNGTEFKIIFNQLKYTKRT
jgi:PAS domain S-box-containing protein